MIPISDFGLSQQRFLWFAEPNYLFSHSCMLSLKQQDLLSTFLPVKLESFFVSIMMIRGFDIVAGLMFPTTVRQIEVLPDVTYGNRSIFDLLPVSCFSGKKFDLLQVL